MLNLDIAFTSLFCGLIKFLGCSYLSLCISESNNWEEECVSRFEVCCDFESIFSQVIVSFGKSSSSGISSEFSIVCSLLSFG